MNKEMLHELKNSINNSKMLIEKITEKPEAIEVINIPETQKAIKYVIEVDKLERPQTYYHAQIGRYAVEVRKTRNKKFTVKCYGFTPEEREFEEHKENTTKRIEKRGNGITNYYDNENFEEILEIFEKALKSLIKYKEINKDNLLMW